MEPITPSELSERLAGGEELSLLDVREMEELSIAKLDGALHIPMGDIPARIGELDPAKPVVCICHHGVRSASVAGFLEAQDFERVYNLTGGIDGWAIEVDPAIARY